MVAEVKCPGSDFFVKVSEWKLQQKQQREQQEIVDLTMGNNELGKDSESLTFHPETWNPMWSVASYTASELDIRSDKTPEESALLVESRREFCSIFYFTS
ncbi:uncharacterized protein LOC131251500 isoform X2 [Magnolia sinica]|uniref:uncharacterized protein LOC131251500 isoform X2 n=1 Tax=Magnolia sinica TaxID=86752 RepID=UPI00265A86C2|nr:uncharacterized protein LOC131251500 isoform X2 [Magnolia sinica]